ncbi:MAG: hypothetical protein ACLQVG_07580, partial [Terriglobia bacterium]
MPEEKDPVTTTSLATLLVISSALLMLTLVWALYNEFFGLRPWKSYQREFARRYHSFLLKQIPKQKAAEKEVLQSADYRQLDQQLEAMETQVKDQTEEADKQIAILDARFSALTETFTTARAYVATQVYEIEHTSLSGKPSLQKKLAKYAAGPFELVLPSLPDGRRVKGTYTFQQLQEEFNRVQLDKAEMLEEKSALLRPVSELRKKRDSYLADHLDGLTDEQLRGLVKTAEDAPVGILQINIPDAGIVDRCESCHVGIRDPGVLTAREMGGKKVFVSHPDPELLRLHDPEKVGCSPCHGGNGMQVESVEMAHGNYEHWLWPLHPMENVQAGCQQCHAMDMVVDHAPVLSYGK